jgi:uncharacterized protein YecT (DUF1311 family)
MTRRRRGKIVGMALAALLLLGIAWPAPTKAESVPASFDCAEAGSTVEKFICAHALLRWNDLALSRAYAAAKAEAVGAARDDLVLGQRNWVGERDRRCIAGRSFAELSAPASELAQQAYECLKTVYLERRRTLQDLAAAPFSPIGIKEIDLAPIAAARPEIAEDGEVRVAGISLSPDGALAAILLPSLELDGPDQAWLYRIADGRLVAATPTPDQQQPHPDGTPMAIETLAWQGNRLYVRVAEWGGAGETAPQAVYAANINGSTRLDAVPTDIAVRLDAASETAEIAPGALAASDAESPDAIEGNGDFLAWIDDLGHGTIELRMRQRAAGSPTYLVAWGSWELWQYLFDTDRSQLVHAADPGIAVFDLATHGERCIAATSRGDRPHAIAADFSLVVWSTHNACGDEYMTEQDEEAPERFCLAHLPQPEESK